MSEVVGIQAVRAALRETPELARSLFILVGRRDARVNELIDLAKRAGVRHQSVEAAWFSPPGRWCCPSRCTFRMSGACARQRA